MASPVPDEWSPFAPSSSATAIGWKKKAKKKRSRSPKVENGLKRAGTLDEAAPAVAVVIPAAKEPEQDLATSQKRVAGPLNKECSVRAGLSTAEGETKEVSDHLEQGKDDAPLPESVSIQWEGTSATVTFMAPSRHICILGRANVKHITGEIEILGHTLENGAVQVESPTWTSAITMHSMEPNTSVRIESTRQQQFRTSSSTFSLENPSQQNVRPTMIPASWQSALDRVLQDVPQNTTPIKVIVCGAKHVGKSTCIRYSVNRLLGKCQSVALLDVDVGQPEMSPPGLLTLTVINQPLLSPPHHHMVMGETSLAASQHVEACFYGHTSSKADPSFFLQCIKKLLRSYEQLLERDHGGDTSRLPLLVNTDGWVKGMGFEILSATLDTIDPNHVIQLVGENRSKMFDLSQVVSNMHSTLLHVAHSYRHGEVTHPGLVGALEMAPVASIPSSSFRSLRLCTYFLGDVSIWDRVEFGQYGIADFEYEIGRRIASQKPYVVPMDCVQYGTFRGVDNPRDLGLDDTVTDALNGSIVGLCCSDNRRKDDASANTGATPTDPTNCMSCVGLGLIRSIDRVKRYFYILSPVCLDVLQQVDVLVGGSIQVPIECLFRGVNSESFPYLSCDGVTVGIGGDFMKSRNTLLRRANSSM